ncbi:MAG: hypothetical protein RL119_1027 [Actinomycetota bacterium]
MGTLDRGLGTLDPHDPTNIRFRFEVVNREPRPRSMNSRSIVALACVALVSLSVTACGEDETDVAPTTTNGTPAETTTTTLPPYESPLGDIVGEALVAGQFTTLAALLVDAGLAQALRAEGPFTVFAPVDSAFTALPPETLDAVNADLNLLTAVLTYHVVDGEKLTLADLPDGTVLTTLQGDTLTITKSGDTTFVNGIPVVVGDVPATNGIIHVISGVLVPG